MKRLFIIAAAAAVGMSVAGCDKNNTTEFSVPIIRYSEEKQDGVTTLTEYEWTKTGEAAGEKRTVAGQLVYEDSDYEYSGAEMTFFRENYEEGVLASREKRVVTYTASNRSKQSALKVYLLGEDGSETLIERREDFYNVNGTLEKYEHEVNGEIVLKHDNYNYLSLKSSYDILEYVDGEPVRTVSESVYEYIEYNNKRTVGTSIKDKETGKVLKRTVYKYGQNPYFQTGYEVYVAVGDKMVLSEKQDNFSANSDYTLVTFDNTWYEADGTTVKSKKTTKKVYDIRKITL